MKIIMRRDSMIFILENHRIDNATRRCRSDKTKWFYQMLASDVIADSRTGIQVRDARVFRARQCTRKENPTDFPLMDRGLTVGFLRFEMNAHKPFFICGYSFQNELGFQRDGDSFGPGFPIGARAPCWQRIPKGTAFPWQWFPKAASLPWWDAATEQAGSASSRTRSPGFCASRIRLFRCRWCGGAERISEEILGAQQHHRGSQRYIKPATAMHPPSL